jgi:CubicO group peptidase (beta-lactamase class C family)
VSRAPADRFAAARSRFLRAAGGSERPSPTLFVWPTKMLRNPSNNAATPEKRAMAAGMSIFPRRDTMSAPRSTLGMLLGLALLANCGGRAAADAPRTTQDAVDAAVNPHLEKKQLVGVVVGLLAPDGSREFFTYGTTKTAGPSPTADTIFEIGSISKTFTCLLLAQLVERQEARLDDPVRVLLPDDLPLPKRGQREITLVELATHSSGLPNNPPNLMRALVVNPKIQLNPFAEFDQKQLRQALAESKLKDVPSPPVTYSNLGMGLLGEALAHQTGKSYDELVRAWIAAPLHMSNTFVVPSDQQRAQSATGHAADGSPVPGWTFATLAGCGAIRSNAGDMLHYLAAQCGQVDTPLRAAMDATQQKRLPAFGVMHIGLGWLVRKYRGHDIWWHNGGTNGFSSFAAFCRDPNVAVVVLSNSGPEGLADGLVIDRIGDKLMRQLVDANTAPPK